MTAELISRFVRDFFPVNTQNEFERVQLVNYLSYLLYDRAVRVYECAIKELSDSSIKETGPQETRELHALCKYSTQNPESIRQLFLGTVLLCF